jgi:hypothetical protein
MPSMEQFGTALQGMGAGLQGNGVAFQQVMVNRQKEKREAEMQRKQTGYIDAYTGLQMAEAGDWQAVAELSANRLADLQNVGGVESKQTETVAMLSRIAVGDDPEAAATAKVKLMSTLGNYSKIGEAFGILKIPKSGAESPTGKLLADRERAVKSGNLDQVAVYDSMLADAQTGSLIGVPSPKDFTVDSLSQYAKTKQIGDLVRYSPKIIEVAGVKLRLNSDQVWEPVAFADGLGAESAAVADLVAGAETRLSFAADKNDWLKNEPKVLSSISEAEQKQSVIMNTSAEIKKLVGAWTTKYGAKLSGWPGTQARTLAGLIDTIKANSAFTTLKDLKAGGGTLGAISGAELQLLERAWGTLDQGGEAKEFLRVLDQITGQNSGSLVRMRNSYDMSSERYSGSYDDSLITKVKNTEAKKLPPTNDKGWRLATDANGNQAYVGPQGEIEEPQ